MHGYGKRLLSFLLAMVMVFSLVPMQAFAEETGHDHEHTEETQTAPETQTQSEAEDTGDAEVTDTEVTDTEVTDTEVTDTEVTDTEVTDTEVTDTEVTGTEGDDVQEDTTQETESVNPAIAEFQAQIDDMLGWYLKDLDYPKGPLTEEERAALRPQIEDIVANVLTSDDIWMAQVEIYDLEEAMLAELTEAEIQSMVENNPVLCDFADLLDDYATGVNVLTSVSVLDGQVSVSDTANNNTMSNGTVTIKAKGSMFSKKTNTVTITNESGNQARLSFDYAASTYNSFSVAGAAANASGKYSAVLEAGGTVTLVLVSNSGLSNTTATLTLSNFSLVAAAAESNVTFEYDSSLGSITVGGSSVASGTTQKISLTGGAALVATANGSKFLGWIDANTGDILSTAASYTLTPAADMTVKAAFAKDDSSTIWWLVGSATKYDYTRKMLSIVTVTDFDYHTVTGTHLFDNLSVATAFAESSSTSKYVVQMNSGTLVAGEHTIPAGVTVLIPYDANNTLYTEGAVSVASYTQPTAYRTLTLASGANLIINGKVTLSAQHKYANAGAVQGAAPSGPVSFIQMQGNSNITVNNGGTLYAYGFITGSGSVTVKSGGSVYELFQIADFRGGTQSTDMDNGVFPMSQYYVQNIEVPMTLYSGASEYSFTTIYMSSTEVGSSVKFIAASDAMFNLTSGHVVKKYDGSKDRLVVEAHGSLTLSSITMKIGTSSIDSSKYELPINGNITVKVFSGSTITINQDIAMLPGSEIIVNAGATCALGSSKNVYLYDSEVWGTFCSSINRTFIPAAYAPSRTYTRTDADLKDAKIVVEGTVDASAGFLYTTAGGADISGVEGGVANLQVSGSPQTVTYQLVQGTGYTEIPLTPAQLKNADGTYVVDTKTDKYTYENGVWSSCKHDNAPDATCTAPSVCPDCKKEVAPALGHSWNDATCTVPKTCSVCGATEGEALGHTWADATCTVPKTCSVCGATEGEALGHTWVDATCTAPKTCSVCGATEGVALPHTEVSHEAKAPTCTEKGWDAYVTCSKCDYTTYVEKAATGHKWTDATCTAPKTCSVCGATEGEALGHSWNAASCTAPKTCSRCGATEGEALGHSWTDANCTTPKTCSRCDATEGEALGHSWKDATCTAPKTCSRCDATEGEALGHSWNTASCTAPKTCSRCGATEGAALGHSWKDATCTAPKTCSVCGAIEGEALGHSWTDATCTAPKTCSRCDATEGAALGHSWKDATCTAPKTCSRCNATEGAALGHSWKDATCTDPKTCSVCGAIDGDALGHNLVIDAAKDPTCTETGLTEGKHCDRCDYVEIEQTVIDALGHTPGNGATCTTAQTCTVCGAELEAAKGHTVVIDKAVAPTCTATGLTEGEHCSVCGEVLTAQTVVDALGHAPGAAATCTADQTCTRCGEVLTEKLGHDEIEHEAKAPTCTEIGWDAYVTCSRCDYTTKVEKAALNHDLTQVEAKAPTCTEIGWDAYEECSRCGYTTYAEKAALGHAEIEHEAKAPTCTEIGWDAYVTCSRCDYTTYAEKAELGHKLVTDAAVAPTCTETGLTEGSHCDRCGHVAVKQETVKALGHSWNDGVYVAGKEPTCTATGTSLFTCLVCGAAEEREAAALGHDMVYHDEQKATCTEEGFAAGGECSRCGHVTGNAVIPALGHDWGEGTVTKDPTCTEVGVRSFTCSRCGETKEEDEPALGHNKVSHEAKAPTCTEIGWDAYETCSMCGYTTYAEKPALGHTPGEAATCTTAQTCTVCGAELAEALGHTEVIDEAKAPTCTETGLTEGVHCSVCDAVLTAQTVVDALGHTEVIDEAVAPTCTETGLTEGVHCSVCDAVLTAQTVVDALGHTEVIDVAKAPTCTETGLTEGVHCSVCDEVLTAQTVVDALGHTDEVIPAKDPTCTATGLTAGIKCAVCGEILKAQETVKELGHTEEVIPGEEPTCTTAGWTSGKKCSVCGVTLEARKPINALGHTEVNDARVEPTCTETGLTAGKHCDVCGAVTMEQKVIPALGHTEEIIPAVAPTCTEAGKTEGVKCSVCNAMIVGIKTVEATGHTEETIPAVEPTCTETGLTAGIKCAVCGEILKAQETVKALGHTEAIDEAKEPTCTETGLTEGVHCSVCDAVLTAQTVVEALGHTEETIPAVDPTCTETGLTTGIKCAVCGEILKAQETVKALGHTEETIPAVEPTCTETGLTAGVKCSVCDEILKAQETVKALGHTEVIDEAKEPTCTETGLTEGVHCSVCDTVLTAQTVVEALGHTEETIPAVEPTCTETGLTAGIKCAVCGEILKAQETVKALGHTEEVIPAVEPTCTETGLTAGVKCSVCDEILTAQEEVAALDHDMGEATCAAPATCKREGCGHTEGVALEHTVVEDEEVPAMCGVPGLTSGKHCSVCGKVLEKQLETPALEHNIEQHEAKRATYTAVGWEAYEDCTRCGYTTYVAIPMLETPPITDYETFLTNLQLLEELAYAYIQQNPGKDPAALVIKYIRTGVDRYNSGSWGIMAGYEDAGFAKFVAEMEDMINCQVEDESQMICVSSLKDIASFTIPNGDTVDFGHMFGTMDITYHNNFGINHADVAGWAGDLVDLLSTADRHSVTGTVEEMVADLSENYLCHSIPGESDQFSLTDMYGDMDGYYVMKVLENTTYETGVLTQIMQAYFTADLSDEQRADYMIRNRFNGVSTRNALREAVYTEYTSNKVISTLEGTREFAAADLTDMRYAVCYAFADYLCRLAGDFVDVSENSFFTVFSSEYSVLAPGITQEIKMATSADGKQMVYYLATADLTRDDVNVYANYNNNDPAAGWAMQRVLDQANAAQTKYGDPESEYYIENYNVITSINGAGFNMSTGEPGGLLVMGGVEYQGINSNGFFGILKDGTPVIGTTEEYNTIYKGQVAEGIAGFGSTLVKDGEICITASSNYYTNRASRTAVGITRTGKVVFMVLDGRQEPWSCGGSMEEIAQIMLEAGCVHAINLDGGGSTTYVARQAGDEELSIVSRPSDGFARSVSTTLMMVSTAPSSTAFDHALLETTADYMTVGATIQITPVGVSATGNTAELPEGTTWEVSDERWAAITEDGTLTALRYGDVTVNLLLGEEIIGTKVIHIVYPDQVYFTKDSISATYGVEKELPVKALYEGKEVAITPSDVTFTVSPEGAGTVDTFTFTGNEESGIKTAKITAALAHDDTVSASISVTMYKHGENSFDFDKATGGDRLLAWERQVSNSTTDDAITYYVVDESQPMVTSYILAMDMTQIPIPQKLNDLIYMLPGSDASDASAWNFLLQLAERISVLTEVRPTIQIDPNFYVDYSELTVITDYFQLNEVIYDEEANTLTMVLNWIDQTQPIDPATANPLCIVKGLKLIPKDDADWGSKNRLTAALTGEISYSIYMRASSLYSFCQKPENQETFGLKPFINPNDPKESGGYFSDVYITFEDTYTLVNALKNGWVNEDGGYAYYVDGQRLTGINLVDGLYYDFGEEGINVGKKPYTGLFEKDGARVYAQMGKLTSGWYAIGEDYYYFDPVTFKAHTGVSDIKGHVYTFNDEGKLILGAFVKNGDVTNYYWAGKQQYRKWINVEGGRMYVDDAGIVAYGNALVKENATEAAKWYHFDEETGICTGLCDGFIQSKGITYYCEQGETFYGAIEVEGGIIFCGTNGKVVINSGCYIENTLENYAGLSNGYYWCGEDGFIMKDGFATINGSTYYFTNYERAKGFTKIGDDYYLFNAGSGKMYADATMWIGTNSYGVEGGYYYFQADGKMYVPNMQGGKAIIEENGKLYFVIDGVKQRNGLYELEGEYYYARHDGTLVTNGSVWIEDFNDLIAPGNGYFAFGADGKMVKTGFVEGGGNTYYYKDLVRAKGLTRIGWDYYFFNAGSGKMYRDIDLWVGANNYGLVGGYYYFQEDGTMYNPNSDGDKEIVEIDGVYYFLINGVPQTCGLVELKGEYYYAQEDGTLAVNVTIWLSEFNGLIAPGSGFFGFGSDGKMVKTGFVIGDGYTYYYDNIVRAKGFTKIGDQYYFFNAGSGKMYRDITMWVGANDYGIVGGYYYFQEDGTMYVPGTEGKQIVEDGGKLYFVIDGVRQVNGLNELDGEYYFAYPDGHLAVSSGVFISNFNGLMAPGAGQFGFDAEGKMIKTGFIVGGDGYTYYYDNLVRAKGFTKIGDKYYFFNAGSGKMYVNTSMWVGPNDYGVSTGYHTFQEDGSMYVPVVIGTFVVEEGGHLYFIIDGVRQTNGLNELDGEYYYANPNGILAASTSVWMTEFNGLIAPGAGYFAFDAEGKMVKNGFITGGGATYYYDNLVRAKGFTRIGEDYYFFNASSGKMYTDMTLWVGNNAYGIAGGYYFFGADGKMVE